MKLRAIKNLDKTVKGYLIYIYMLPEMYVCAYVCSYSVASLCNLAYNVEMTNYNT